MTKIRPYNTFLTVADAMFAVVSTLITDYRRPFRASAFVGKSYSKSDG